MSWIDDGDYLGPDRRETCGFRIIERRHHDSSHPAPSLQTLLRKLQIWAAGVTLENPESIDRYRARVQTVAKLAHARGQLNAETWLHTLDRDLELARVNCCRDLVDLSRWRLQSAAAALN